MPEMASTSRFRGPGGAIVRKPGRTSSVACAKRERRDETEPTETYAKTVNNKPSKEAVTLVLMEGRF
jgi:hypothetical protein